MCHHYQSCTRWLVICELIVTLFGPVLALLAPWIECTYICPRPPRSPCRTCNVDTASKCMKEPHTRLTGFTPSLLQIAVLCAAGFINLRNTLYVPFHANAFPPSSLSFSLSLSLSLFSIPFSQPIPCNIQQPTDRLRRSGFARVQRIAQEVQNDRFQSHRYEREGEGGEGNDLAVRARAPREEKQRRFVSLCFWSTIQK